MKAKLKILILEDSRDDVDLIERELKKGGIAFTSRIANKRNEFETALREFRPDVVLSDHSLPQFNSIEALKLFKEFQQENHVHGPFILITGAVSEEFAVQCIKTGADDYILKDRLKRLPQAIESALEKKRIEVERIKFFDEVVAKEALMSEAEHLARLGSWQVNLVTHKFNWSDESFRIYGYEPGEIEPSYEKFLSHIHPDDIGQVQPQFDHAINNLDSYQGEFRIIDKKGNIKYLNSKLVVRRNEGQQPIQLIGFNLDITELKKHIQAIEEQNTRLKEIAWIQSHEVRAPLARMMGLINLLTQDKKDKAELPDLLKHLFTSANEFDTIIRRIVSKTEQIDSKENQP